jgi:hypothetical protein
LEVGVDPSALASRGESRRAQHDRRPQRLIRAAHLVQRYDRAL